jgi:hypothetical protein
MVLRQTLPLLGINLVRANIIIIKWYDNQDRDPGIASNAAPFGYNPGAGEHYYN